MTDEEKAIWKKENKSLSERVLQLQADKGKLVDENRELKEQIEKNKTCSRCVSFDKDFDEYPCKDCYNDGVLTNWH